MISKKAMGTVRMWNDGPEGVRRLQPESARFRVGKGEASPDQGPRVTGWEAQIAWGLLCLSNICWQLWQGNLQSQERTQFSLHK